MSLNICSYSSMTTFDLKGINDRFAVAFKQVCYLLSVVSGGGAGVGTVNAGTQNRLTYYAANGTTISELPAIGTLKALVSDVNGLPIASSVTNTELGYVSGVTSAIQTQINTKQGTITTGTTLQYFRGDLSLSTLNSSVVPEVTNLYYTDVRARAAISLTTTDSTGAATYNNSTGVFNIPNYANSAAIWGNITGTLSSQGDLQTALNLKSPLASPTFTGIPAAPTAATSTSTTQLATTAFVQQEIAANTTYFSTDFTGTGTIGDPISNKASYFSNKFTGTGTQGNPIDITYPVSSITTTGTSGVATLVSGVLNIPNYTATSIPWGNITGTLASQSDLNTALGLKAPLASPALTGTPTAPTASIGTNTTQVATTAFVLANQSISLNSITAATGNSSINNLNKEIIWDWTTLGNNNPGLSLQSTSTTAASNNQTVLAILLSGANSNSAQTTKGAVFSNTHTGTTSTNIAAQFQSSGGSTNIAILVPSSSGNVGFGLSTPTALLHLGAGSVSAGSAPLKFTSGTNLTVVENGSLEYDGTDYFVSASSTRQTLHKGKFGSFSQVGAATTVFTVTFGGTQPNATYKVNITPTATLSAALFYVTNKTTTTFDVTYLAGLTGTVTFDYLLTQ